MRTALLLLLAAGCGTTGGAPWDDVHGTEWLLVAIEGAPALAGTEVTLSFDVGRVYGHAVNRYSAQCERKGDTLEIDTVAATRKFRDVPPGAMAQETRYLELLAQADGWNCGGGWLELKRKGETILIYRLHGSRARS